MKFHSATASVIGHTHQKLFYNNQDAFAFYADQNMIVGVVADGCGSSSSSEVGARLAVDFTINFCRKTCTRDPFEAGLFHDAIRDYLQQLVRIQHTNDVHRFAREHLLFTLVGFVMKADITTIFYSGDGYILVNEEEIIPESNNRPDYLGKELYGHPSRIDSHNFQTEKINRLLVATDGLLHFRDKLQTAPYADFSSISDLFSQDDFFENEIALPKFISSLSATEQILGDDTTLIMLRKISA